MQSTILTVGLNHTTAPIAARERIASEHCLREEAQDSLLAQFDPALFSEVLILSTCNRTEVYAVTSDRGRGEQTLRRIFKVHDAFPTTNPDYCYAFSGRDAAYHLFAVASGIDSMLLGEFEILGQIRQAFQAAVDQKRIGPVLHQLFQHAVTVGKRARSETAIGAGATSIAYAVVALAREQLGGLKGRSALVVGAGEMGQRTARNLVQDGACAAMVASRNYDHAVELAARLGSRAISFQELTRTLAEVDLVISATKAPHLILTATEIASAMESRPARPLCLIDIAVPRDIDPEAKALKNVRLFNIDDLQALVESTRAGREQALDQVRSIIAQEVAAFWEWHMGRRAAPLLSELDTRAEAIRRSELARTLRRLDHLDLSERDREAIVALSMSLVKKILAAPRTNLKERMQSGDGQLYLEALRELFDLEQVP